MQYEAYFWQQEIDYHKYRYSSFSFFHFLLVSVVCKSSQKKKMNSLWVKSFTFINILYYVYKLYRMGIHDSIYQNNFI